MSTKQPDPVLRIDSLCIDRGGVRILDHFAWTIQAGERWALIGPNGCGKTVLLGAILAYQDMGAGSVELFGHRHGACEWQSLRRRVGLVSAGVARAFDPSERADHLVCTGVEGDLSCFVPPPTRRLTRARRLLGDFGMGDACGRSWGVLSQGERSRVLIARALIAQAHLLILDEPCEGLDPVARERYLADLEAVLTRNRECSTILVSHHIEEIPAAIDRVLLMRQGRVVFAGSKRAALRSDRLSATFASPLRVRRRGQRYHLEGTALNSGPSIVHA